MNARRIRQGDVYWVSHGGDKIRVVVRCAAHSESPEWVCEGPGRLFLSLPAKAFVRRAESEMRSFVGGATIRGRV